MVFRGSIARRLISLSTLRRGGHPSFFYTSRNLITFKCFRHEAGGSIDNIVIIRYYLQYRIYQFFLGIRILESC